VGWLGGWIGGAAAGSGGTSTPPVPTGVTTVAAIRDRIVACIEAITPEMQASPRFRAYRQEGPGDFVAWAEQQPAAALRRFSVRSFAAPTEPSVSNTDVERVRVVFEVSIAYPQSHRYGAQNALDRDDVAQDDRDLIRNAIGLNGGANFVSPYPPATFIESQPAVLLQGASCDFHILRQTMEFARTPL
jgi:hypothetical protein